jgi:hypothetical protein
LGKFASGNKAYGISDRSGFRYRLKDMKKEWNGLLVGPDEFEPKHPQLFPKRRIVDPQSLRNARPETNLEAERNVTYGYNPVGSPTQAYFPKSNTEASGFVGTVGVVTTTSTSTTYTVTVASYLGSNVFYIGGERQPTLDLSEGSVYIFDWSAATSHPFRFSTTSDGTHNGGTEYTIGVVKDNTQYTTQITVATGAPTLYYYCSNHSGMGGQANTP